MNRKFRPDIEGLRAIAVLLVVLYHAGVPGVRGGFVGVDVFFVISGFLITTHLVGELRETGHISIKKFYARRIRRLLPAACTVTVFTVVGSWLYLNYLDAKSAAVDAVWTTFFGLNFRLAQQGVDYQANTDPSPLQHYWSLAVEEQFYLVWPAIVIGLTFWWARKTNRKIQPMLLTGGLIVIVAVSLTWCIHETTANEPSAYFLTPARAWELGFGALVALFSTQLQRLPKPVTATVSLGGLAALLISGFWFTDNTVFPGYAALMPVLGAAAILIGGLKWDAGAEWILRFKPLQKIGSISYGWYLWHWPLLILLPGFVHHDPTLLQKVAAVTFGLWLATVTNIAYENPLRFLPQLRRARGSFAMGVSFAALVFVAIFFGPLVAPDTNGHGQAVAEAQVTTAAALKNPIAEGLKAKDVPSNLTPNAVESAFDTPKTPWSGGSCMVSVEAVKVGGSCLDGATKGKVKILLTGDSHAYQWEPAVEKIAKQRGWQLSIIAKSGCPLYDATVYAFELKRDYTECNTWRTAAYARITKLDPDIIITSAYIASYRGDDYAAQWNKGVASTLKFLGSKGAPVVVIEDTPWPNKDMPKCIATHLTSVDKCSIPRVQPWRDVVREDGTLAAAKAAKATIIDPTDWLCTTRCPAIIGNTPVYHDTTHITATYAGMLAPVLNPLIPAPRA